MRMHFVPDYERAKSATYATDRIADAHTARTGFTFPDASAARALHHPLRKHETAADTNSWTDQIRLQMTEELEQARSARAEAEDELARIQRLGKQVDAVLLGATNAKKQLALDLKAINVNTVGLQLQQRTSLGGAPMTGVPMLTPNTRVQTTPAPAGKVGIACAFPMLQLHE